MSHFEFDLAYLPLGAAAFGGAERSLLDLAGAMVNNGSRVIVLAGETLHKTTFSEIATARGIRVEWVAWSPERSMLLNLRESVRVFREYPARIIHFNVSWRERMWIVPVLARLLTGAKLIGSMRAMPDPHELVPRKRYFGILPGLRLWHLPEVIVGHVWARMLDITVSINANDFPKRLAAEFGFAPETIRIIYNGIAAPENLLTDEQRRISREYLGASDSDVLIVYSGRLSREKGVHVLIHALARLPNMFRLAVVGDGPQRSELETLTRELGTAERVRFVGFLREPDTVVGSADVAVVPSLWYEAFGRVVVEAMSLGVPVVASRIGGMAELFEDGVHGRYVMPDNVEDLTNTLVALCADRSALRHCGAKARELVLSQYSLARVQVQYAQLYAALAEHGGTRTSDRE